MQELRANTEVIVRMGPFLSITDGITPVTTVGDPPNDLSGTDEAEVLKHNGVATVDIETNVWNTITDCDG